MSSGMPTSPVLPRRPRTLTLVALLSALAFTLAGCSVEANAAITKAFAAEDVDAGKPRPPTGMKEVAMPLEDGRLVTCIVLETAKSGEGVGAGVDCDYAGAGTWVKPKSADPTVKPTASPAPSSPVKQSAE